jgi:hypothetical protein
MMKKIRDAVWTIVILIVIGAAFMLVPVIGIIVTGISVIAGIALLAALIYAGLQNDPIEPKNTD